MPPLPQDRIRIDHGGFWQINIGHVVSIGVFLFSFGMAYQSLNGKLETQQTQIISLQTSFNALQGSVVAIQTSNSATTQDLADMHKIFQDDVQRRLAKLEERWDK